MRRLLVVLFLFATALAARNLRIGPKAFRHIRHVSRHERGTSLPIVLRTDDGDRTPANTSQVVWVRE